MKIFLHTCGHVQYSGANAQSPSAPTGGWQPGINQWQCASLLIPTKQSHVLKSLKAARLGSMIPTRARSAGARRAVLGLAKPLTAIILKLRRKPGVWDKCFM